MFFIFSKISYLSVDVVIKCYAKVSNGEAINWNESINLVSPIPNVMNFSIELGIAVICLSVPHTSNAYLIIMCES